MKNRDMPAMPQAAKSDGYGCNYGDGNSQVPTGLTKREMFAMHMMASWINHHGTRGDYSFNAGDAALSAIECADALLVELEK
jgi:hypothetical protein